MTCVRKLSFLSFLLAQVACASSEGTDSVGAAAPEVNAGAAPLMVIEGDEMNFAADIFTALEVKSSDEDRDGVRVEQKEVAGLSCERTTESGKVEHRCVVKADMSSEALGEIYAKLNVPMIDRQPGDEVKVVGPLILAENVDGFRILKNDACVSVPEGDQAAASKCADFWATEVFSSFEDSNTTELSDAPEVKSKLVELLKRLKHSLDEQRIKQPSLFIGALFQETDDGDISYYEIAPGRYAAPRTFARITISDVVDPNSDFTFTKEDAKRLSLGFEGIERVLQIRADD